MISAFGVEHGEVSKGLSGVLSLLKGGGKAAQQTKPLVNHPPLPSFLQGGAGKAPALPSFLNGGAAAAKPKPGIPKMVTGSDSGGVRKPMKPGGPTKLNRRPSAGGYSNTARMR